MTILLLQSGTDYVLEGLVERTTHFTSSASADAPHVAQFRNDTCKCYNVKSS